MHGSNPWTANLSHDYKTLSGLHFSSFSVRKQQRRTGRCHLLSVDVGERPLEQNTEPVRRQWLCARGLGEQTNIFLVVHKMLLPFFFIFETVPAVGISKCWTLKQRSTMLRQELNASTWTRWRKNGQQLVGYSVIECFQGSWDANCYFSHVSCIFLMIFVAFCYFLKFLCSSSNELFVFFVVRFFNV